MGLSLNLFEPSWLLRLKRGIVSLPCYDLIQPSKVIFVTINFYPIIKIYVIASYDSESLNNIFLIAQK